MRAKAAAAALCMGLCQVGAAPPSDAIAGHVVKATKAAGSEYAVLVKALCPGPIVKSAPIDSADRDSWHAEPVRAFDDLFYVGQKTVSAWALRTSAGIIVIDALFDYSVEDEIWDGLRKAGLDPSEIRYVIVTHGHSDHLGGAAFLQRKGATIVLAEADWPIAEKMEGPRPTRDARFLAVSGRRQLTLGNTTVDLVPTPGHTPGTLSVIFPVHDGKARHMASIWGGTGFNTRTPEQFSSYARSARDFARVAQRARVDVPLSNHPVVDDTFRKADALAGRKSGDSNPFVTGQRSQQALLTTAAECADASLIAGGG
ncbi:MBL fold metallo-hydrolase (plasmid) [Novosphingobium resinovorum]|uniref:MBL fold metallo-hydrolase n=2 Tax=Novosphingobium TaxID=165696 RepID=UPI0025A16D0A|nr:MBL fold metallo-hydrolase [Novosphingobium resinovorum]MBF7015247.1 MBL fold metallo-hydrolase [Novosphingobium sp. HR1a]WJM29922.1 MBL fold metallo-hydrolase [Novosphingobium resinovorum]